MALCAFGNMAWIDGSLVDLFLGMGIERYVIVHLFDILESRF